MFELACVFFFHLKEMPSKGYYDILSSVMMLRKEITVSDEIVCHLLAFVVLIPGQLNWKQPSAV